MASALIESRIRSLRAYCEAENFEGWDPYDGLNSPIIQKTPLRRLPLARLAWIQLFKRSPINLRPFTGVAKGANPKGLGLFLTTYCNLARVGDKQAETQVVPLAERILELVTPGYPGACWGYNFDWQSRAFFLPAGTPTVVASSFVARALMDAYDLCGETRYLEAALSCCDFMTKSLNRTEKPEGFIFSYSAEDTTRVYNASLLGSLLLARAWSYDQRPEWRRLALESARAVAARQREDGAWRYGELDLQSWVDSFHTGYNLECLAGVGRFLETDEFTEVIRVGTHYYLDHFFLEDGTPKYYDDRVYPIDVHAPAQLPPTLAALGMLQDQSALVERVLHWAFTHLWDERGYLKYQIKRGMTSRIPYMRWAQAWMLYGTSFYLAGRRPHGQPIDL